MRIIVVLLLAVSEALCETVADGVRVMEATRHIDISSQLETVKTTLDISNEGSTAVPYILHGVDVEDAKRMAFIDVLVDGTPAKVSTAKIAEQPGEVAFYKIELPSTIAPGGRAKVVITEVVTHKLEPHPSKISQADTQLVLFTGNAYVTSPYPIARCKTTVKLPSGKVESFTKVAPSEHKDATVTYGAYDNLEPMSVKTVRIHYENYSPFIVVTKLERSIEISHWGNVAVEEYIEIEHVGAKLQGPFSRYDYQRDQRQDRQPSVASFKTILPASARDVYYRDEIGNISTSHMRVMDDAVEVVVRPRFPLFGGWKTNYVIGYNVPSYEYLFSSGNSFALKMRFFDHVFDNIVVDDMTLKIILPERSTSIKLTTPFTVTRTKDGNVKTYLDYAGRPIVYAHKKNLVEQHIQDFELRYTFDRISMVSEPLMLIAAFFALFAAVIVWMRFDFTISVDEQSETRQKVQGMVESVADTHANRLAAYQSWLSAIKSYLTDKDSNALATRRKKCEQDVKRASSRIADLQLEIKPVSAEVADRMNEIARLDRIMLESLTTYQTVAEKSASNKIDKKTFTEAEKQFRLKFDEAREKCDNVVYAL